MSTKTTEGSSAETPKLPVEDAAEDAASDASESKAEEQKAASESKADEPKETDGSAKREGRRLWIPLPVLAASTVLTIAVFVALAIAIGAGVWQWVDNGKLSEKQSTQQQIRDRAGEFGKAMLSYDYTNTKKARERVVRLASTDFAKTYETAFSGELEGVITRLQATATAAVRDVYVNNVDSGRAKAIAVMDSEVHSTTGTRRVVGSYLEMELIQQQGQWRINAVSSIGAVSESMTKPDGTPDDSKQDSPPLPGTKP